MPSINNILIANRSEIASRIIRTCRKIGIRSIAVFSEADRHAPFVAQADTAVFIGESSPSTSYLDQDKIIQAAKKTGVDAIHPGYGFLAENAVFAQRCETEGFIFIGPHPEAIEAMGSKSKAKTLMQQHQIPIVPGYQGRDQSVEKLKAVAEEIGFPVLLKATAGGGGKGMRIVYKAEEIEVAIEAAKRESLSAFGDDELIVEKYIASGRHIEFQIFGDKHGNAIHILERECSIQRRYQKVIEESPSPIMDGALRARMGEAAIKAAKALNYDNAGTVEFIYDDQSGEFYFLEVNTRLQVEHPVTEEITGLDLVQMQIEAAQGMALNVRQEDIQGKGYAIECRLYAEDPANDFLPVTGTIQHFETPNVEGLRIESAIQSGSDISIFYDPMIAKIIVWDKNRQTAHRKMQYVLRNMVCQGITTNQDFLLHLLENQDFQEGKYNTHFIQNNIDLSQIGQHSGTDTAFAGIAATLFAWHQRDQQRVLLRTMPSGWRNNFYDYQQTTYLKGEDEVLVKYRYNQGSFHFLVNGQVYNVSLISIKNQQLRLEIDGLQERFYMTQEGLNYYLHHEQIGNIHLQEKARFPLKTGKDSKGGYEAPMPSQIVKILVSEGQEVTEGEGLIILSSMKMENTITATANGTVEEIYAIEGQNVAAGFVLLTVDG